MDFESRSGVTRLKRRGTQISIAARSGLPLNFRNSTRFVLRMKRSRFAWLLALAGLVAAGFGIQARNEHRSSIRQETLKAVNQLVSEKGAQAIASPALAETITLSCSKEEFAKESERVAQVARQFGGIAIPSEKTPVQLKLLIQVPGEKAHALREELAKKLLPQEQGSLPATQYLEVLLKADS